MKSRPSGRVEFDSHPKLLESQFLLFEPQDNRTMFDRDMYNQSDAEVRSYLPCSADELRLLYETVKRKLKEYDLYGKKIQPKHEARFGNILESSWDEAVRWLEHSEASYHDGLRAMGSLALKMNRNIHKRRKEQKRFRRQKKAAIGDPHLSTTSDVQIPLPEFIDQDLHSAADATPSKPPRSNPRASKDTSHSINVQPSPEMGRIPATRAASHESPSSEPSNYVCPERETFVGKLEYSFMFPKVELSDDASPEREASPESIYSPTALNSIYESPDYASADRQASLESPDTELSDDAPTEREASPESPNSAPSDETLAEHSLAKLVILVESKKGNGMKLCYQFRDLVPRTSNPQPFCIDQTKWDVFSKKLQKEMHFDVRNDRLKVACEGLCNGASIIHDSSLHAMLQLQVRLGKSFIVLEVVDEENF